MAMFKVNYFFKQGKYGWSETYYLTRDNHTTCLNTAQLLIASRVALLGGDNGDGVPTLEFIRVSDVEKQRDSLVFVVPSGQGKNITAISTADNPNLALLCRVEADPFFRRQLYLRGQPDSLV